MLRAVVRRACCLEGNLRARSQWKQRKTWRLMRMHRPDLCRFVTCLVARPGPVEWDRKFTTTTQGWTAVVNPGSAVIGDSLAVATFRVATGAAPQPWEENRASAAAPPPPPPPSSPPPIQPSVRERTRRGRTKRQDEAVHLREIFMAPLSPDCVLAELSRRLAEAEEVCAEIL